MNNLPETPATADVHPHAALIAGLRELADWYEQHPDVPAPRYPGWRHCVGGLNQGDKERYAEVRAVADVLGVPVTGDLHRSSATRRFGSVVFEVFHVGSEPMRRYTAGREFVDKLTDEQLGLAPASAHTEPAESRTESDRQAAKSWTCPYCPFTTDDVDAGLAHIQAREQGEGCITGPTRTESDR